MHVNDLIEETVAAQIEVCDPGMALRPTEREDIIATVTQNVLGSMDRMRRSELDKEDRAYIKWRVSKMAREYLPARSRSRSRSPPPANSLKDVRFRRLDHVVCNVGGDTGWASGTVHRANDRDPQTPGSTLAYVVRLTDATKGPFISLPQDDASMIRAEVCFGLRPGGLYFTLYCLPTHSSSKRRFGVGERVACAIEDEAGEYTNWAAGSVTDIDYTVERAAANMPPGSSWGGSAGRILERALERQAIIPYRVHLDHGRGEVLVHRDEHWLIRDLELQMDGPRQAANGTRCLDRIDKRKNGDQWTVVDHETRRVRAYAAGI
jgi:hypothetical protein